MAKFKIDIQADASVFFKLMQLKKIEDELNTQFVLDDYLSEEFEIKELVFSFSALGEFSFSVKPDRTEYRVKAGRLIHHTNLDLETIVQADELDLQEIFADTFIGFFEEYENEMINTKKLIIDFIDSINPRD